MLTFSKFIVAPLVGLVLSLALCGPGVFAQNVNMNVSAGTGPATAIHSHDGPSPVDNGWDNGGGNGGYGNGGYGNGGYGNGGYGNGGYGGGNVGGGYSHSGSRGGGFASWNHHSCTSHCGSGSRSASRCVRFTRSFRSNLALGRQGISSCKWIRGERW